MLIDEVYAVLVLEHDREGVVAANRSAQLEAVDEIHGHGDPLPLHFGEIRVLQLRATGECAAGWGGHTTRLQVPQGSVLRGARIVHVGREPVVMGMISDIASLEARYGVPNDASTVKEIDRIAPHYRALVEASPFAILATCGPEGLDCSPRGDRPGFVHIEDERTLVFPDRRGNDRIDSLRNIVRDPRVALLFLIPGSGTTLRVNGRATLHDDAELLASFAIDGRAPRCVVRVAVQAAYFQCARAIVRADLWNPATFVRAADVPTPGAMLAALSAGRVGGPGYDAAWPERARGSLW